MQLQPCKRLMNCKEAAREQCTKVDEKIALLSSKAKDETMIDEEMTELVFFP